MTPTPLQNVPFDFWYNETPDTIELSCLMPNGIYIPIKAFPTSTIREIKEDLWETAKSYPLYHILKEPSMYVISAISAFANLDEFYNESKRIADIQPYFCVIRLSERTESKELSSDDELCKVIGLLIGRCVNDFRSLKNLEINDFRYKMSIISEKIEKERLKMSWNEKLMYQNPLRLSKTDQMPNAIKKRLRKDNFVIVVKLENDETSFTFCVPYHIKPHKLLDAVLSKMARTMNQKGDRTNDFILKVFGRDEYLFGDYPLIQFMYIQETLSGEGVPTVVMKLIQNLEVYTGINSSPQEKYVNYESICKTVSTSTLRKRPESILSWSKEDMFNLTLHTIENINCDINRTLQIGVRFGLYHGERLLCAAKTIYKEICVSSDKKVVINEQILFDISLLNIPRMARLCLVIFEKTKSTNKPRRAKENKEFNTNSLAWVNTMLFDFKNQLKTDDLTLFMWNYTDDIQSDIILNPLGTVESNPRTDECAAVKLTFFNYGCEGTIIYPPEETILKHASKTLCLNRDSAQDTRTIIELLAPYLSNDRLYDIYDQERNAIWAKRHDCLNDAPNSLPLLLYCVYWNKRDEVSEMCSLLKKWPKLSVERALELLDYAYPDPIVRRFAINCLRELRDEDLLLYLLQLVQAIKHESYLDCDLVNFLLERALKNQRIGHYFFWHLRSELHIPSMQIRFGLLLEAYLKASTSHIPLLIKQLECLERLKTGSEIVKTGSKEKVKSSLQDFLTNERNLGVFADLLSPLNPSFRCKGIKPDKCKVMDSKMRPLWIVFENADTNGEDVYVIFKNGDDLRQDMLTLQMLRVMDQIWKSEGHDFRMNIYGCISMERRLGMIEVVLNAETIANIQKERGMCSATSPFHKGSLFNWLKEHNPTEEFLEKAIKEFTYSCAGYCVATFVLGVADRHSDNIMVKKNGQLFHIDFGHILGHFKEKFGVRRERVPFVLTYDFVYVINKGRTDKQAEEFRVFQTLCEDAFLILRKHGCLILSLFAMMISTGLPELSSEKDLNYLKETLVLELTEEKAREHFRNKFSEALANSWKTSLNWASHNISKSNKQ